MKCDICGEEVENKEALLAHIEQVHPAGGDRSTDDLETPDLLGDTPEESAAAVIPLPTH
jgi:hypothetical protein